MPAAISCAESASFAPTAAQAQPKRVQSPEKRRAIGRRASTASYKPGYPDVAEPRKQLAAVIEEKERAAERYGALSLSSDSCRRRLHQGLPKQACMIRGIVTVLAAVA